jgi:Flp pilus assembly pilin Flp
VRSPEPPRDRTPRQLARDRGAATVEHAGLSLLVALLLIAGIAALAAGSSESGRELGFTLARKLRCAAVGPGPCWRDPLTTAYGRPLAGAVRALAPPPQAEPGPSGPLLAVDFRTCRRVSCAAPGPRPGLTASNRRVTAFTSVADRRAATGTVAISYWDYRPTLGWEERRVVATSADVARLASTPLLEDAVPALVALETLDGRNHYEFPPGEEPPWRWTVESVVPPLPG